MFSFGFLVAPNLKKEGGTIMPPLGHNVLPEPSLDRVNRILSLKGAQMLSNANGKESKC